MSRKCGDRSSSWPACKAASERPTSAWQRAGIALETVRRAILLASVRGCSTARTAYQCGASATSRACWTRCGRSRSRLPFGGTSSSMTADARGCGGTGLSQSARPDLAQADSSGGKR